MRVLIFLIVCFSTARIGSEPSRNFWIIWNVGQGLWTTARWDGVCYHFDVGGERWPLAPLRRLCSGLENRVTLSHSDWDHIGGLGALSSSVGKTCVIAAPQEKVTSSRKKKLWSSLPACDRPDFLEEIHWSTHRNSTNAASRVFLFQHRILIPGDSPSSEEEQWDRRSPNLRQVEILVLGHHGSRTSTSTDLLSHLPSLKIAISSARWKKYGHPHIETIDRLRAHHIGLLRTEDWGHFIFEL